MTEFKNENIDELLSKFFSPDQAEQIKDDFASADSLFEKFPAPNPPPQILAEIKQRTAQQLENRNRISPLWSAWGCLTADALRHWTTVLAKTAAVAAIVVIVSAIMLLNFSQKDSIQYTNDKQQASLLQSDTDISAFEAEITQLKNELLAINLGEETGTNGILTDRVEQVELEIIETENTFWKG
ncbi:MAG: hypothetical protein NTW93_10480 [Phycisphaerae bacterium]|nr:hypothetical protein [Phycisphaerae bacterium]